jgi:hypothetical protein
VVLTLEQANREFGAGALVAALAYVVWSVLDRLGVDRLEGRPRRRLPPPPRALPPAGPVRAELTRPRRELEGRR